MRGRRVNLRRGPSNDCRLPPSAMSECGRKVGPGIRRGLNTARLDTARQRNAPRINPRTVDSFGVFGGQSADLRWRSRVVASCGGQTPADRGQTPADPGGQTPTDPTPADPSLRAGPPILDRSGAVHSKICFSGLRGGSLARVVAAFAPSPKAEDSRQGGRAILLRSCVHGWLAGRAGPPRSGPDESGGGVPGVSRRGVSFCPLSWCPGPGVAQCLQTR